jgi:hypothetical protein
LAARKGKAYVYGFAFTFGACVLYDLAVFCSGTFREGFFPRFSCSPPSPR